MNYRDIEVKKEYRSNVDNIVDEFYLPVLNCSKWYDRAVGFFSSTALADIATGIASLASRNGRIRIISSPKLTDKDVEDIRLGYKLRNDVIKQRLYEGLSVPSDIKEKEKLNILASLIADGILDIRIAVTETVNEIGMYHEKMGLLYDEDNNIIAFSGSMNESTTAYNINYESIDVYCDWENGDSKERVDNKRQAFNRIWEGKEDKVETIQGIDLSDEIVRRYKDYSVDYESLINVSEGSIFNDVYNLNELNIPKRPNFLKGLRAYQEEAIDNWVKEGYKGIFVMATGTGKTYTGLAAAVDLYKHTNGRLAMVIVCPQKHLVDQWVDDLKLFNIDPIIGHSDSVQKDYKKRLHNAVLNYNLHIKDFFCFICTNATFASDYIQNEMHKIIDNNFLMVDEAHNFGADNIRKTLEYNYSFRLALSATFDRHNDEVGTQALIDFFGARCIDYSLENAIENGMLTPYYYYPIVVCLTEGEYEEYKTLTYQISQCIIRDKIGSTKLSSRGKIYAQKRARIVAAAKNKEQALLEAIKPYNHDYNILVYCGAASLYDDDNGCVSDLRQIDEITSLLGNNLGMKVSQFTSNEDSSTRKILINNFEQGNELQALVAIKCLDEGVNIPSIRTAFILASTTNPKEYIQRRGRVLRTYPGKEYATIFDFITLPRSPDEIDFTPYEELRGDVGLVKNELSRMIEFKRDALNPYDSDELIYELIDGYSLVDLFKESE